MASKTSSSDKSVANSATEPGLDEELIQGFLLALRAGGRREQPSSSMRRASVCFPTSPGVLDYPV